MPDIVQHITVLLQQVQAWFPWLPSSTVFFFAMLSAFLALALALLLVRALWAVVSLPLRGRRRRAQKRDPRWQSRARLRLLRQQHHWQRHDER
jgi:NhaP-type Na+/H+ or K+/H+ antiporter